MRLLLIIGLVSILASCAKEQEVVNEEPEELSLFARSYDNPIEVPCKITRLKKMLERALSVTKDTTLISIFTDSTRVEYIEEIAQKNYIVIHMRSSGRPQYTVFVSDRYHGLTDNGAIFVVIHELYHIYSHYKGAGTNDSHHSAMVKDFVYRNWVGGVLGIPQTGYMLDYLVYSGTYESPVYLNLSDKKKKNIKMWCENYGLPF